MRRVRWLAVPFAIVQFTFYRPPAGISVPFPKLATALGVAAALTAVNVLSLYGRRFRDPKTLQRIGSLELVADVLIIFAITWIFAFDPTGALWALLVIPPLEGALRGGLRGAMLTWGAIAFLYPVREFAASQVHDAVTLRPESVSYRLGIILIVALASGYLARNLRKQVDAYGVVVEGSERRAELLGIVAAASRSMTSPEVGKVLDSVAEATVAIGFDGTEICLFDERSARYRVMHPRGLPEGYAADHPFDTGIAGLAYRRQMTVVVGDYAAWHKGIPAIRELGYRTVIATPIWSAGELVAVLVAGTRNDRIVSADEVECLELLALQAGAALTVARRFTERRAFEETLTHQAFHDALTGLPNRALFLDRLNHCLERKARSPGAIAVLFLDLDHFKKVNDSLGHDVGDELLRAVADRLTACLRPADTIARFGGDEFTVLVEGVDGEQGAVLAAMRLCEELQDRFSIDGRDVFVSASIGIAYGPASDRDRDFIQDADLAMYRAKELGGSRVELYRSEMTARARRRLEMETELRRAIRGGELELLYQPLVSLRTGRMAGLEALVRWEHPARGRLLPAEFIPLAEETGLIVPLGRWVLEQAYRQVQIWNGQGDEPLAICVNLSAKELRQHDFMAHLTAVLNDGGPRQPLVLEVTESVVMRDDLAMLELTEQIHALGVRLAIDDFGLGYSSLSYLKRFPFSILKIDRSFVSGLTHSAEDMAIVRSVINLSQDLGIEVVAEGVETMDQLQYLRRIGCDVVQGFHLFRPLPASEVDSLLTHSDTVA